MKKYILFLLLITSCIACRKAPELEGFWQHTYNISQYDNSSIFYYETRLFDFTKDSLYLINIRSWKYDSLLPFVIDSFKVKITSNKIIISNDKPEKIEFSIIKASSDSIVLSAKGFPKAENFVLKPVKNLYINQLEKTELIGNAFNYKIHPSRNDTIDFLNDSTVLENYHRSKWGIANYKGYNYIYIRFLHYGHQQ